ncbi:18966_t:CDS:2 [Gigaspora margarita]|uniref:18966_t:CDS:1 n=1 Tax=Gigaspora margarita TaxID=4874 RepID=A0ABN7VDB6_GIGMA|nr:18966_t:CDS:2 [Gigaspora margarita]
MVDTCNNYVTQPEKTNNDDNYPFAGNFSPKANINLHKYEDENGPYFVFLDIVIVDPNFPKIINDSTQISSFRIIAFDSCVDSIRLWGVVHSGCCGIRLFKEKTEDLIKDIIDKDTESANILNNSREDPLASIQYFQESSRNPRTITSRIKELENFRDFIEKNVIKIEP